MLSVDSVGLPSFHSLEELAKRQGLRGRDHVGEKIHPNDGQFCILATQAHTEVVLTTAWIAASHTLLYLCQKELS